MSNINFQFFFRSQGIAPHTKVVIACCSKAQDKINSKKHLLKNNDVLKNCIFKKDNIGVSILFKLRHQIDNY